MFPQVKANSQCTSPHTLVRIKVVVLENSLRDNFIKSDAFIKSGNMEFARGANTFPGETTTFMHKGVVFETQGGLTATIGVYICRI